MQNLPYSSYEFNVELFFDFLRGSFSASHYLNTYEDIKTHCANEDSEECSWAHYRAHGLFEGREIHQLGSRTHLLPHLANIGAPVLEIGPFLRPCLIGENVKYFEVLDTKGLEARAKQLDFPVVHIPDIDFVHPSGDMSFIDETFDAVISSHCIEHQPDLINHLKAVERVLSEDGEYYVLCPDKRLCFDYFNPETRLIDVIAAHLAGHKVHTPKCVLEHRTCITHNMALDHWHGSHGAPIAGAAKLEQIKLAQQEIEDANGGYVDVHAWIFTPINFLFIMQELQALNYTNLKVEAIYPPVYGSNEFISVLKKA